MSEMFPEPPFRLSDRTVALAVSAAELDDTNEAQITLHLAREVQASRKLIADLLALLDRMGAGTCENVTTPGFHCERYGRTPDARYGADQSCPSCDHHELRLMIEAAQS